MSHQHYDRVLDYIESHVRGEYAVAEGSLAIIESRRGKPSFRQDELDDRRQWLEDMGVLLDQIKLLGWPE